MTTTVATAAHALVVIALVIVGAVTNDHALIDAGLAYGAGAGLQATAATKS